MIVSDAGFLYLAATSGSPYLVALVVLTFCVFAWRYVIRPKVLGPGHEALRRGAAVVVTGCDTGFGRRIALDLHQLGATVFAGVLSEDAAASLRAKAREGGAGDTHRMRPLILDVSNDEDVAAALKAVEEFTAQGAPLFALVNNAGISAFGFAEAMPLERAVKIMDVNYWGTVRMTKAFLPLLRKGSAEYGPGRVVNMGSISATMPSAFGSAYTPTKAAMTNFSSCVRQEVARFGVKVSLVEPGFWATSLLQNAAGGGAAVAAQAGGTPPGYPDFAPKMATTRTPIELFERLNGDIGSVTGKVVDVLVTRWPLARYTCGYDAQLIRHLVAYVPAGIVDLVQTLTG